MRRRRYYNYLQAENVSPDRYSVSSLTSDAEGETININTIISTILTYAKTLGTNATPQEIENSATSFTLNLASATTNVPAVYDSSTREDAHKLSCTLLPDSAVLQCTTNANMANPGDYKIYYINECNEFLPTGMTVTRKSGGTGASKEITISSIGDSQCVTEAFTSLTVTLSESPATTFTITLSDATNTHTFNFNCISGSTTPICIIDRSLYYGVYKATSTTPSDSSS